MGGGNVALARQGTAEIESVTARQRWPWNNLVDIEYAVSGAADTNGLYIRFEIVDGGVTNAAVTLDREPPVADGTNRVTWNPEADGIRLLHADGAVCQAALKRDDPKRYLVIDLSKGVSATASDPYPVNYLPAPPAGGWTDEYKTNCLVMRKIDPGAFTMGEEDKAREVTLTEPFYIAVFEVTQAQWKQVTGGDPSSYKGDARPVERVSYDNIRGSTNATDNINWPTNGAAVSSVSFLGLIRERTGLAGFDLPTEAQWEYACRAGTVTDLNNGRNLENPEGDSDPAMADAGRYRGNGGKKKTDEGTWVVDRAHAAVGSYKPNAWGLYDMHGNVWEWCRDWYEENLGTAAVTNPPGPATGTMRVFRGGSWSNESKRCRSANRDNITPDFITHDIGFRPVCPAGTDAE